MKFSYTNDYTKCMKIHLSVFSDLFLVLDQIYIFCEMKAKLGRVG